VTHLAQALETVPALLEAAATTTRGITLTDRNLTEERLSFADLHDRASRTAGALRTHGVEEGDRVCILGPTTSDLIVVLFGTWMAGGVPVMLPLPRRLGNLDAFIADVVARTEKADARVLAVSGILLEQAPPIETAAEVVEVEELAKTDSAPAAKPEVNPDDLAFLQFTSGTTATSKAVALTHRNLAFNIRSAGRSFGLDPEQDVAVSWLPLFHDMGLIGLLFGCVMFGVELVLLPTEEFLARPGSWVDALSRYQATITVAPNFGYGLAARDMRAKPRALDLSNLRLAGSGAEPIDTETCAKFLDEGAAYGLSDTVICPMYGLAEATLAVSVCKPDEPMKVEWIDRDALETEEIAVPSTPGSESARSLVACGDPIEGLEVVIKDRDGDDLGPGRVGEICLRGPSVMAGYWRDPQATAQAIRDGWLHTGDLGFWGQGGLVICGRKKDMIILGGRNLYPEDYEFFTEQVPGVRRGNVIAFAIPDLERMVVVAETTVEAEEAGEVAQRALEELRRSLPRGPEEVVLVAPGTLPKTSSGKRQRGACREIYATGELAALAVAK
jgi:fatty-acyl-CoA synthase